MEKLVTKLCGKNPGAWHVQARLQYFSKWPQMIRWLYANGYVEEKLWKLFKDQFGGSTMSLGKWIEEKLWEEAPTPTQGKLLKGTKGYYWE